LKALYSSNAINIRSQNGDGDLSVTNTMLKCRQAVTLYRRLIAV